MVMKKVEENIGLSSYEALGILHDDIEKLLNEYSPIRPTRLDCMKEILSHSNELSTYSWSSALILFFIGLSFVFTSFFTNVVLYGTLAGHGIFMVAVSILNILIVSWENKLRHNEIPDQITNLLSFVKECQEKCDWKPEHYPHLCSPYSPCITLQWTYRDNNLVNLPWALLCRGDTIVLRPGQAAPGTARREDNPSSFLANGEIYCPPQKYDHITAPTARVPFNNARFILTETPLLRNIREVLESASTKCLVTSYDKQIHLIMVKTLQHTGLPILVTCSLILGLLRTVYIGQWVGNAHWTVTFLLIPSCIAIPILPICFPAAWLALHTFGNAKLSAFLQSSSTVKTADPFEDISIDEANIEDLGANVKWGQHIVHTLLGRQHSLALTRSSNPLHILASVTALCCVDKKGILSWPNPTAEKVFFLRTTGKTNLTRTTTVASTTDDEVDEVFHDGSNPAADFQQTSEEVYTRMEVLDLTHERSCPFKLQFDDARWPKHLPSLKPIGLAILLNTCNMSTHEHYLQFCSHVTCEALYNEDLVPVTNRSRIGHYMCVEWSNEVSSRLTINKCLCELPKQIGFVEEAKDGFYLLEQLCAFRHVQPDTVRRDIKFAKSLAFATKLKLPFPHMVAVVLQEGKNSKTFQLFSQATGDIALDCCVDFWDGKTIRLLSSSDRKKILDFYQRTSLTAYCTAFAYRPLGRPINSELSKVYMELPPDCNNLYSRNRSPTPIDDSIHRPSEKISDHDVAEEVNDIEGCFEMQCNQIFLGMVTMQYQAQSEMVHLIEQLERACIRFVHFSKENELRSRVFSEKMGLESGWNCHISLLSSEDTDEETLDLEPKEDKADLHAPLLRTNLCGSLEGSRAMSVSAPCAINTESSKETPPGKRPSRDEEFDVISQDGWQSLSCLTDSTEQSAPINFDMSNRAKLPRGIDQIRPHLEQVDNVPLLVSLFTDCTPSTTQQMIGIMQEYGEIVCVMGSSANADNSSIFLKANASVSVEPHYPQVCQKIPVYTSLPDSVSPVQLSGRLNSLPCTVAITRQRPVSLFQLIMHARHFMQCLWNCVQFWLSAVLTVSLLQTLSSMIMLPAMFSAGQNIWICCFVIPLIAISLVHCPANPQVMLRPVSKNYSSINSDVAVFVAWCYGLKFLPSLLIVPIVFGVTLASHCSSVALQFNSTCSLVYPVPSEPLGGWEAHYYPLINAQMFATTLLVIHLVTVSVSFVHREFSIWRRSPFRNKTWLVISVALLIMQFLYTLIFLILPQNDYNLKTPWIALSIAAVSPFLIFIVNELVKWQEIKANLRYEKRGRLDFGTKLGMNSPF